MFNEMYDIVLVGGVLFNLLICLLLLVWVEFDKIDLEL